MALTIDEILDKDILDIIGVGDMPEEKKAALYIRFAETIQNTVMARILTELDKDNLEQFSNLLEENNNEKIKQFLEERNVDIKKMFLEEAFKMKAMIATLMDGVTIKNQGNQNG